MGCGGYTTNPADALRQRNLLIDHLPYSDSFTAAARSATLLVDAGTSRPMSQDEGS